MTLPDERYRSMQQTWDFLRGLAANPKLYPRIPKRVRDQAAALLRHYPNANDLERLAAAAPHVVQEHMDPLHKMVAEYSEDLRAAQQREGMIKQNKGR